MGSRTSIRTVQFRKGRTRRCVVTRNGRRHVAGNPALSTMKTVTAPVPAIAPASTETAQPDMGGRTSATVPVPNQPTTAQQLQDVKLSLLLDQKPSFETLKALGLAKLTDLAKENVEAQTRVKNSADKFKKSAKGVGKILAAMKVAYADAQDTNVLSRGFEDYHKSVTGEKPWNHAMQCAVVFCELVLTGKLTEADYDRRAADWLQHASVILNAVKKNGGTLDSPEIAEVVDILKNAADDEGAKKLRQMKAKVKGTETAEPGDPEILSVSDFRNADVLVRRVCQTDYETNGTKVHGLSLTARIVTEYVKSEKREDVLQSLYVALNTALDAIPEELQSKFLAELGTTGAALPEAA